jgi:hypothetical protein
MVVPIKRAPGTDVLGVLCLENFRAASRVQFRDPGFSGFSLQQLPSTAENSRLYQVANQRAGQLQALTGVAAIITKFKTR